MTAGCDDARRCRMVGFRCAGYGCLLDARQVAAMSADLSKATPMERCFAQDVADKAARRCLMLRIGGRLVAMSVAEPVRLQDIDPMTLFPLPVLMRDSCRYGFIRALQSDGEHWRLVLSTERLSGQIPPDVGGAGAAI